jgi:hypothetical protein
MDKSTSDKYVLVYEKDSDGMVGISRLISLRTLPLVTEAIYTSGQLGGVRRMFKGSKFYVQDVQLSEKDSPIELFQAVK